MNYILTTGEIQTLAALMGAKQLVGLGENGEPFSRDTAVASVLSLTRRGILEPEEDGLTCQEQVRRIMAVLARPDSCILVTDVTMARPQIMCYGSGETVVAVSQILQRPGEVRLTRIHMAGLPAFLREEGYLPQKDAAPDHTAETQPADPDAGPVDLYSLPMTTTVLERLDPVTAQRLYALAVAGHEGAETICLEDGASVPYSIEELTRRLLCREEETT